MANRFYVPVQDPGDPVTKSVQVVARLWRVELARSLRETGLHPGQDAVIDIIWDHGTATPGQIAEHLGVQPPTITKTLGRMQDQGFVRKVDQDGDGRQVHVALTEKGEETLEAMHKARKKAEKRALKGIKKKERKSLVKLLEKMSANLLTTTPQ